MGQMLLLPDPRPLDRRLGGKFFRKVPRRPGVYLMKDSQDRIVYVGKAKDLRQRRNNYRIANPDRMPRRHLRMVNEVSRIDFEFCPTEAAALRHEKKLIRAHRPKFNRAGVWPGRPKFIVWRTVAEALELSVVETPQTGWQRFGPLGGGATYLQQSLTRLLWLALHPEKTLGELPAGWACGECMGTTRIPCGADIHETREALEGFFWREPDAFLLWLGARYTRRINLFERRMLEAELENLKQFGEKQPTNDKQRKQLPLL